jgi:hypothetical protein
MSVVGSPNMNALTITIATTATAIIIPTTITISVIVPCPVSLIFCNFSSTNVIYSLEGSMLTLSCSPSNLLLNIQ